MSIKIAVGAKIYDVSQFSEDEEENIQHLAKSLNYRVNQVISAFGIYEQEFSIVLAALSILEELETVKKQEFQPDLFEYNPNSLEKTHYSKKEVEEIILKLINTLNEKLKSII